MRIEIHQEANAMRMTAKGSRYSFIAVVSVCFFLSTFVFSMPLYAVGEIAVWGGNGQGQCDVPDPNAGFTAIAAGGGHTLGLKQDGSIVGWGFGFWGQCDAPLPNTDFIAIAAGDIHSLGLKSDGSIVAFGSNRSGECNIPAPNTDFVAIAANGYHSLGLKNDGSIVAWGRNLEGQCDVPQPNTGFIAIAAGWDHSLGLKQDGSIVAWGANWFGQRDVPYPNRDFKAISAGTGSYSLGLKQDGSIVAWGSNISGQCEVPLPNTDFVDITAGAMHALGLKKDGSIVAWGAHSAGECNVPSPNTNFTAISAGEGHSLALKKHNIAITKCSVTAGKIQGQDTLTASGGIEFPSNIYIFYPYDMNHIDVNIISLIDGVSIYTETVNSTVENGKFRYTHKIRPGETGAITSLMVDFRTKTFSMKAKNIDLTGLSCPLRMELTLSDIVMPWGDANEMKVNGTRTLIPTRLLRLYGDTLVVDKAKARHNNTRASSDSLYVTGDIALANMDLEANEPNLATKDVVLTWGDINGTPIKTLTIPANTGFKASRTGHVYKCSRIHPAQDPNSLITAQFDLDRCTFRVSISRASSVFTGPADAIFGVSFDTFSQTADVNHITGRSW